MQFQVLSGLGEVVGSVEASDFVFDIEPRPDILSRVVHWQLSKRRQGTHAVKTRGYVSGSTKKIYKQKGTGQARHGARRGAQFRGGGIIFGPVVRSHEYALPKKVRRLGLRMALSEKYRSGQLIVVERFSFSTPTVKTRDFLRDFSVASKLRTLLIDGNEVDQNFARAIANLESVHMLPQIGANVYDIMLSKNLILSVEAVKALEARLV